MNIQEYIAEIRENAEKYIVQVKKDYEKGKRDCANGQYDKFYHYNQDDGIAYDIGWREQNNITQNEKVTFLEA